MSAFIVRGQVIGDVVQMIDYMDRKARQHYRRGLSIGEDGELPPPEDEPNRYKALRLLGERLLVMNCHAVAERYEWDPGELRRDAEHPTGCGLGGPAQMHGVAEWPPEAALAQWIKSTDCLLYQCSEGDVPDEWVLFDEIQQIKLSVCEALVKLGDEYGQAKWDRD